MNEYEVERGASFTGEKTRTQNLKHAETSQIKYDLIGKVAEGTTLTRKTVSAILQGIRADKLYMFKNNPEEFITKVIRLINEQKATIIVEHISYDTIEGEYDSTIFTAEKNTQNFDKAFLAKKAIQDYVFTDGSAEKSIERKFAEDLDAAEEVCVYAKLPRTFQIPTPVLGYMIGSFVGSIIGSFTYNIGYKAVVSFCVDSGFTMFGLVEQDYTLPKEIIEQIGIETFEYETFQYDTFEPEGFSFDTFLTDAFEPDTLDIAFLRRGVIGVSKVGYIL